MKMMFMRKNKKGITLVESVLAVVILAILCIGVISLLTAGGVKIFQISDNANAHAHAVQQLDMVISAISNGSAEYITTNASDSTVALDTTKLTDALKEANPAISSATISAEPSLYDNTEPATNSNFSGCYLTLTYKGATVYGFASNSEGAFARG